jgi:hypothetical protein
MNKIDNHGSLWQPFKEVTLDSDWQNILGYIPGKLPPSSA